MTDLNLTGQHFIAGNWPGGDTMFDSAPSTGPVRRFSEASQSHVDAAVEAAEEAFMSWRLSGQSARATFLRAIADEIEAAGALVTEIGHQETGLPEARLKGSAGAPPANCAYLPIILSRAAIWSNAMMWLCPIARHCHAPIYA